MLQDRKKLRLEDFDYADSNYVFFATLCARQHSTPFNNATLAERVVQAIHWSRTADRWKVFSYCLMPDHLHIAVSPATAGKDLSQTIAAFKSWTTREAWKLGINGKLWQRSWYDHIARKEEDLLNICEYILANPVRRGLVDTVEKWPYSGLLDPLP